MQDIHYDLAIVGCGIIGAVTATLVALRYPSLSIIVIEKKLIGQGATCYSAGLSVDLFRSEFTKDLIIKGHQAFNFINDKIKLNTYNANAHFIIHKDRVLDFKNSILSTGVALESSLSALNAKLSFPSEIQVDNYLIYQMYASHYASPSEITEVLMAWFRRHSNHVCIESIAVASIKKVDGLLELKLSNDNIIKSKKVVLTVGSWWKDHDLLASQNVINKKVVAFHLTHLPLNQESPAVLFHENDSFLLPLNNRGHWIYSISSNEWNCHPTDDLSISNADIEIARDSLNRYLPQIFDKHVCGGRVFCDVYSENREPSINYIMDNMISVTGLSGSGYRLSFGIAEHICESFLNE